jgi:hypothetical protein
MSFARSFAGSSTIARQSGKKVKAPRAAEEAEAPGATTNVVHFVALLKRVWRRTDTGARRARARVRARNGVRATQGVLTLM